MEIQNKIAIYYGIIIAMLAFVIIAGGLILVFIRYQKKILFKQQQLFKLDAQYKQDLLLSSIESAEAERMRIAKDIHDEIGSIFSTLAVSINRLNQDNLLQPEHFDTSKTLIQAGINSVRRISHAIVPFELELLGLRQTLENHFETITKVSSVKTHFETEYNLNNLTSVAALAVYRIIQELSNNCIKYAAAKNMEVKIVAYKEKDNITVYYKDNGKGADMQENKLRKGIGLKNIESRAISLDGSVNFVSRPGEGFTCEVNFPLIKNTTA